MTPEDKDILAFCKARLRDEQKGKLHIKLWERAIEGFLAGDEHRVAAVKCLWERAMKPGAGTHELRRLIKNAKRRLATLQNFRENSAESREALDGSPSATEVIMTTDREIERLRTEIEHHEKVLTQISKP